MNPRLRLAALGAPALLIVLVFGAFFADYSSHRDRVPSGVEAGGIDLSGATRDEAVQRLEPVVARLSQNPITVHVNGGSAPVLPADLGLTLDTNTIIDEAMSIGRSGGIIGEFRHWITSIGTTDSITLSGLLDEAQFQLGLEDLASDLVGEPPFQGAILVEGDRLVPEYPRTGLAIDPASAVDRLMEAFLTEPHPTVELELVPTQPELTDDDITAALAEARTLLDGPITLLTLGEETAPVIFSQEELTAAFRSSVVRGTDGMRLVVTFDEATLIEKVAPIAAELSTPAVNAELLFDEETHLTSISPSHSGTSVDFAELLGTVVAAAATPERTAELPVIEEVAPEVTTEDLEALGIVHMVSSFTTYHSCCQDRVVNIQTMASTVNGTMVGPDEIFSLNEVVGQRTEEKGYRPAGTIVAGVLEDTIGGGVSQFSTTLYNAVFWGGYEDVVHWPHSYYFSRYPEGIEATLNWPDLHNKFRNDTEHWVVVRTRFTDTSITVEIWGNNDGRVIWGDQWRGRTTIDVLEEGGPNARRVDASVSSRYAEKEPQPRYMPDDTIRPGGQIIDDDGHIGWSVNVVRTIDQAGEITEEDWTVRYSPQPILTRVHSCMLDEEGSALNPDWVETCPEDLPPTVTLAGAASATVGEALSLEALAADDWDETLSFAWTGSGGTFGTPTAHNTTVTFDAAGTYTVTVIVTDGSGNSEQDSLDITVSG